jgi:hypothetical protein
MTSNIKMAYVCLMLKLKESVLGLKFSQSGREEYCILVCDAM